MSAPSVHAVRFHEPIARNTLDAAVFCLLPEIDQEAIVQDLLLEEQKQLTLDLITICLNKPASKDAAYETLMRFDKEDVVSAFWDSVTTSEELTQRFKQIYRKGWAELMNVSLSLKPELHEHLKQHPFIFHALSFQKWDFVDIFESHGIYQDVIHGKTGRTILHHIALFCSEDILWHIDLVKYAHLSCIQDNEGNNCLHLACESSSPLIPQFIQLFAKIGATFDQRNNAGNTPFWQAMQWLDFSTALLLAKQMPSLKHEFIPGTNTPLHLLSSLEPEHLDDPGAQKLLQICLESSPDVDIPDQSGDSPLVCAIRKKNYTLATALFDAGANPQFKTYSNESPASLLEKRLNAGEMDAAHCYFSLSHKE